MRNVFKTTVYSNKVKVLTDEIILKYNYINKHLDKVPVLSKSEKLQLADIDNMIDNVLENKAQYEENYFKFFKEMDPLMYYNSLKTLLQFLIHFERKSIVYHIEIHLN